MNVPKQFKFILFILGALATISIVYKANWFVDSRATFTADEAYQVTYRYFFKTDSSSTFVKAFLPKNTTRQEITAQKSTVASSILFSSYADGPNLRGNWSTEVVNAYESISYSFSFKGKEQSFGLTENFKPVRSELDLYLMPTEIYRWMQKLLGNWQAN